MKSIIETFIYLILFSFIAFICVEFVTMNMNTSHARETHSHIIDMIEDSDYSPAVINETKTYAKNKGFEVTINDESKMVEGYKVNCYRVTLSYKNKLALLGVAQNSKIEGYAKE